jgi:hypothetical protein
MAAHRGVRSGSTNRGFATRRHHTSQAYPLLRVAAADKGTMSAKRLETKNLKS